MSSINSLLNEIRDNVQELCVDNYKLTCSNTALRDLIYSIYRHFYGVVFENWSYTSEDFAMYETLMKELGVETEIKDET